MPEKIDPNQIERQFSGEAIDDSPSYSPGEQNQLDEIRKKRQQKFANMGVKIIPEQNIMESASSSAQSGSVNNLNARDRIIAIKQGLMKGKMRELNEAKSPNEAHGEADWMDRDIKRKQQEAKRKAQGGEPVLRTPEMMSEGSKLKGNGYKSSSEAEGYESMFTGEATSTSLGDAGSDAYFNKRKQALSEGQGHAAEPQQVMINEDSFGGSAGSWEDSFRAKKQGWGQQNQGTVQQNQIIQEQRMPSQDEYQQPVQAQPGLDLVQISRLIESTVEKTVEKRVKGILSEFYSEMESKKNTLIYKRVKGKESKKIIKDVIMIEGKYFRITEIQK